MNELRKDYLLDKWVIIASGRKKRPSDFVHETEEVGGVCYFCPGNENMTPPEICRVEEGGKWAIRCFPNKFPAVSLEDGKKQDGFLTSRPAYGEHEIVVETSRHDEDFADLSVERIVMALEVYSGRIEELKRRNGIKYVSLFRNKGNGAGASFAHSHAQIISLPMVPPEVLEKIEVSKRYAKEKGACPYCGIWKKEVKSERQIFEDENVAAFAPYASRFPFAAQVMPKRHIGQLGEMTAEEKRSFATAIKKILKKLDLEMGDPAYNMLFHIAPVSDEMHLHVEVFPRVSKYAGFEFGTGIIINIVPPEEAAEFYRS
ncbi:MAG: galactose-1-phosphate uridylyltransferase [Candidatus Altiarchaeales archaeon IMC4]|nr:MAG: galactose-1-phosphate uridylyltransferase [Candidatus Altiarchaeales archaeon IMC4]